MSSVYLVDSAGALSGPVILPVVPGVGVQLPDNAVELVDTLPMCPPGFVWAIVDGIPLETADLRGTVYRTDTGAQVVWSQLGRLPDGYTTEAPQDRFYVWLDGAWQLDQQALLADQAATALFERDIRLGDAATRIAPLQDAQDLGEATPVEEAALLAWKRHRVALNRIEQQAGFPAEITWPTSPR
ncbi:tail fiber assembly protein [Pseudomonas sp. EL_65y_Pfl2_R96]|uniref:tail fiber assembly protein n=1 Tax=Pseudomonas sp. EL_65y_Pfl2_R96 TaxID=3088699 RepID=UPI0030D951A7